MRRLILALCLLAGGSLFVLTANYIHAQGDDGQQAQYVGGKVCAGCHQDVGSSHNTSRHALALQKTDKDKAPILGNFEQGEDVRTIQFPGEDGTRAFTADDVAFAVGAGRYAQAYLMQVEDGYMVLPAIWNTVDQTWQPYALANNWPDTAYDWNQSCAGCHVTAFQADQGTWKDDGVQCEACHGPGSLHIQSISSGDMNQIRGAIVLSPDSQICGQCHSQGTEPGGRPFPLTYRPGETLLDDNVFTLVAPDDPAHWWSTGHAKQKYMQFNEWSVSGHPDALAVMQQSEFAADACLECHSQDYRWAAQVVDTSEPVTVENAQFGVTCVSCHIVHAVDQPAATNNDNTEATQEAETGSSITDDSYGLCVSCHNDTDVTEGMHHPTQEMFEGLNVIDQVAGVASAHFVTPDGPRCETCHMPRVPVEIMGSRASHTDLPVLPNPDLTELQDTCSTCHSEVVDVASLQDLISDIQTDTQARLEAARAAVTESAPEWVITALDFVDGDASLGIHNYVYTDELLDAVEAELGLQAQGTVPAAAAATESVTATATEQATEQATEPAPAPASTPESEEE